MKCILKVDNPSVSKVDRYKLWVTGVLVELI